MLKKQPPIRGPKVLQDAWDKRKTVKQNYAALGLVSSLNPNGSGGSELRVPAPQSSNSSIAEKATSQPSCIDVSVPRGYGRITRDQDGNVIDIELGEELDDETMRRTRDKEHQELDQTTVDENMKTWIQLGANQGTNRTKGNSVVQELEKITEIDSIRPMRFISAGEKIYLQRLVGRHGDDFEAMAKDRKRNSEQRTAGELRRSIRKAGGVDEIAKGLPACG